MLTAVDKMSCKVQFPPHFPGGGGRWAWHGVEGRVACQMLHIAGGFFALPRVSSNQQQFGKVQTLA